MIHLQPLYWVPLLLLTLLGFATPAAAQPTYLLKVKPELKPHATLRLDGLKLHRSAVKDDPGFRLQYHFRKDGKTVAAVEARANPTLEAPLKEAGTYTVALEMFYPTYKGGTDQKGAFKPISDELTLRVEPGAKPGDPVKISRVEPPPKPAKPAKPGK